MPSAFALPPRGMVPRLGPSAERMTAMLSSATGRAFGRGLESMTALELRDFGRGLLKELWSGKPVFLGFGGAVGARRVNVLRVVVLLF